jgi:iron complex outermembrane receptor protein
MQQDFDIKPMFPHFSILTLVSLLSASLAVAADPVLKGDPVLIRENKIDAAPSLTTVVSFAGATFEAGTEGLSERAANFFVASSGAHSFNDTFALRGLTNTPIFGDPAVTFYLDDIPVGGGFTTPDIFGGIANAELNRGPGQNTVFGQAGSAGVVRLTTPELGQKTTGQINLSAGNFSSRNAAVTVGSASGGPVEAYVSTQYGARNGYIFNDRLGHDVDHRESSSGVARLSFSPSPLLKLSLIAQAMHAHDGEQPMVPLGGPMFVIERKNPGETNLAAFNAGLTAAVSMPWGRFSATTSINDWRLGPYRSVLSFGPAELINDVHLSRRNYNQELKLTSNNTGSFRWHSGVFFSDGVTKGAFTRAFGPFVIEDSSYDIDAHTLAAYGETSWDLQPNLTLTAGLRLEDAKKTIDRTEKVPLPQIYNITHESSALLPKIELNYSITPNTRLFGSIGTGFKPGGFSGFTGNRSLSAFGPERTIAWEAGIAQTALKGVLSSTVRAFLYDIRGYQIERSFATSSVADDYLVVNAPKARSVGAEWEFAWRPIPGLSLSSNLGLTQVTLREFKDPYTGQSFNGKQAPFVPRYDYGLSVEYRNPSGWFGLVKWAENGRTYYTESENITFAQRSYRLFGGRLGCAVGQWSLAVYAENIFNQHYYSSMSAGTMHGTPGAPRTQGVDAQFAF